MKHCTVKKKLKANLRVYNLGKENINIYPSIAVVIMKNLWHNPWHHNLKTDNLLIDTHSMEVGGITMFTPQIKLER